MIHNEFFRLASLTNRIPQKLELKLRFKNIELSDLSLSSSLNKLDPNPVLFERPTSARVVPPTRIAKTIEIEAMGNCL